MLTYETFTATPLDRETIPQHNLDIAHRVRTNLLPWAGQFSPQLVEELLLTYGKQANVILDPFVGSGTLLVEAARLGKAATGNDINPAATTLAGLYCLTNLSIDQREAALNSFDNRLRSILGQPDIALLSRQHLVNLGPTEPKSSLTALWKESNTPVSRILASALVVLCDFYREDLSTHRVLRTWTRIAETVRAIPTSRAPIAVSQGDARALPIESNSVDLILTSPPYINVHNYHQQFRRSVEALGWNVLAIAPSEIGSNRQNRRNRFLTVIQYALDMALAIREIGRVTTPEASAILVLGRESTVRRVPFFNGELVAELAAQAVGLQSERRQERKFVNRYGKRIVEDILHFSGSNDISDEEFCLNTARAIAGRTLSAARLQTTDETRQGIEDALEELSAVSPSPMQSFGQVTRLEA